MSPGRGGVLLVVGALAWACDEPPGSRELSASTEALAPESAPVTEPEPEPESQPEPTLTLIASGDLVLNPAALAAALDAGDEGYDRLLDGLRAAAADRDAITYLNLEVPLVNDVAELDPGWPRQNPSRPRRSPVLGATPPLADAIASAGVDVVSVANNHAYDQGHAGLGRTLTELDRVHVAYAGAGDSLAQAFAPVVLEHHGLRVAFLSFTDPMNQHPRRPTDAVHVARLWDDERVLAAVRATRESADIVVCALHWSRDFEDDVSGSQRRKAAELIEAGADVILGTGPHVLQSVERLPSPRGEALVAYSLGNLVSGMARTYRPGRRPAEGVHPANVRPEARDAIALRVRLRRDDEGVLSIEGLEAVPLWTANNWLEHVRHEVPYRVSGQLMADTSEEIQRDRLPGLRERLGPAVALSER